MAEEICAKHEKLVRFLTMERSQSRMRHSIRKLCQCQNSLVVLCGEVTLLMHEAAGRVVMARWFLSSA